MNNYQRFFTLVVFLILATPLQAQSVCLTKPPTLQMDQLFYDSLKKQIGSQKIRLALFPFYDGSALTPDPTLESGFAIAFYDLLKRNDQLGIFHPYVIFHHVKNSGLVAKDYFDDQKIIDLAKTLGATHAVYGMFQKKMADELRFFVKVVRLTDPPQSAILEFQALQSDRLFSVIGQASQKISSSVGAGTMSSKFLSSYLEQSPDFEAFRFYVKGMMSSASYHEVNLSIAAAWFDKASTLSYHFTPALQEKGRSLLMQALIYKQMQKDFSVLMTEARQAMEQAGLKPQKNKTPLMASMLTPLRWLNSQTHYTSGLSLLQGQKYAEALKAFAYAVEGLPEDGLGHYYLSKAYEGLKNPKAAYEMDVARGLNPCL